MDKASAHVSLYYANFCSKILTMAIINAVAIFLNIYFTLAFAFSWFSFYFFESKVLWFLYIPIMELFPLSIPIILLLIPYSIYRGVRRNHITDKIVFWSWFGSALSIVLYIDLLFFGLINLGIMELFNLYPEPTTESITY